MGVFANTALRESYGYAPDELSDVQIRKFDESESIIESSLVSIMEANEDWNSIINEMAAKEYAVLESTGEEMVYEAVDVRGFFSKIVDWFKKLWAKIAGLFQKFLQAIQTKVSSDKAFIEKYETAIKDGYTALSSKGFAFKGHDFKNLNTIDYTGAVSLKNSVEKMTDGAAEVSVLVDTKMPDRKDLNKYKKAIEKYRNGKTKIEDNLRGAILYNKPGKAISAAEFSKKVKEHLLGKEFTQYKGDKEMSLNDIITEIKLGKYSKEECKNSYNALKNSINQMIAEINNYSKNFVGMDGWAGEGKDELKGLKMSAANLVTGTLRTMGTIYQQVNGIQLSCMNMRHAQARAIAMKLVQVHNKELHESAAGDYEDLEDLMEV